MHAVHAITHTQRGTETHASLPGNAATRVCDACLCGLALQKYDSGVAKCSQLRLLAPRQGVGTHGVKRGNVIVLKKGGFRALPPAPPVTSAFTIRVCNVDAWAAAKSAANRGRKLQHLPTPQVCNDRTLCNNTMNDDCGRSDLWSHCGPARQAHAKAHEPEM